VTRLRLSGFRCRLLQPIDLELIPGQCLTLSGPSGSGKSLLLRAIADLDPHDGGLSLNGQDYRQMSGPEWRRQVALLPAETHWWAERVGEHFTAVEPELLAQLGFDSDCLEWEVSRLSSGERQRLGLARVLAGEPEFMLLDEPSANLDAANTERLEACIATYRERRPAGVLWVSHDPEQRRRVASRGLLISEGKLVNEWI
jgi:ABC-type iron transport system FetAB ATPase subunit